MVEPGEPRSESSEESRGERVGDALRTAVERTLAATAGSAAGTRQRAGELLDEVARRGLAVRSSEPIRELEERLGSLERLLRREQGNRDETNPQVEGESSPDEADRGA